MRAARTWIVALALAGCGGRDRAASPPPTAAPSSPIEAPRAELPRLDDAGAELVLLSAEIDDWRARADRDLAATGPLVDRLLRRARVEETLEDYVEADRRSAAWVAAAPADRRAQLLRARVHARVHRFGLAREALDAAIAAGLPRGEAAPVALELDQATGVHDAAIAAWRRAVSRRASSASLAGLAGALADAGRFDEALALMPRAWARWRGNSALGAAGLLFAWGQLHEQAGQLGAARDRYQLAWRAAPVHREAATHLAGVLARTGERDRARRVLEELRAGGDHPELAGMLAPLVAAGDPARARALHAEAVAGWQRWVAALPEAFAHHAEPYLGRQM